MISEALTDDNWRDLILTIKADFGRVALDKAEILKSLERWIVFPNKFQQIGEVCADLHAAIVDNVGVFEVRSPSARTKKAFKEHAKSLEKLSQRASKLYASCIQLSLLTPILAEAFVNMLILILCKGRSMKLLSLGNRL